MHPDECMLHSKDVPVKLVVDIVVGVVGDNGFLSDTVRQDLCV
jgi:hypothetical protein